MNEAETTIDFVGLTAEIVSAYVANNPVPPGELTPLIDRVHTALVQTVGGRARAVEPSGPLKPAVSIGKSITQAHLVCLEDGKIFKSLKRHLRAKYNLSPEQYRAKWGLPHDYPMVAPDYAKARSDLAKSIGLGQTRVASYDEAA